MAIKKIKLTSQTAWETQKDLNNNFSELETRLDELDIPENTSDLTNDGDGTSPFATQEYVAENGGKIDSISVNRTPQIIDENKNVDIAVPTQASDVHALPDTTKYGATLGVSGTSVTLKDQDGNTLSTITTQDTDTGATSIETTGIGNAVTSASYDDTSRKITLTKGTEFQPVTDNGLDTTSKSIVGGINEVNSVAKQANIAKSFASYSALITELNSASATAYKVGQSFYVQTQEVPDLWVMSIESSSSTYTYTTDSAFITATAQSGGQQVGYYKLAQLETQKVDLTNYVQKSTTIAGVDLQDNITKSELLTALNVSDGAEVNTIESISVDNVTVVPDANKNVNIDLSGKLDKVETTAGDRRLYAINANGTQTTVILDYPNTASPGRVPCRSSTGALMINNNTYDNSGQFDDGLQAINKNKLIEMTTAKTGSSAPTTSTVGFVGQLYRDTTNDKIYVCENITTENNTTTYTWTQLVRMSDKASANDYGIVKIAQGRGLDFLSDGRLYVDVAGDVQITNRTIGRPLSTERINFAVKSALTDNNRLTMTSSEQDVAQEVLGNAVRKITVDSSLVLTNDQIALLRANPCVLANDVALTNITLNAGTLLSIPFEYSNSLRGIAIYNNKITTYYINLNNNTIEEGATDIAITKVASLNGKGLPNYPNGNKTYDFQQVNGSLSWTEHQNHAFKVISAPSSTTLTDAQISDIIGGAVIEEAFQNRTKMTFFPGAKDNYNLNYSGMFIGKDSGTSSYIGYYKINVSSKVLTLTNLIQIADDKVYSVSNLLNVNGKTIPAYPSDLTKDYVLKQNKTSGTLEWVQDSSVKNTDYATTSDAGIVKVDYGLGTAMGGAGNQTIYIVSANNNEITNRSSAYKPIVPTSLNTAVKSALSDSNHLTMTTAEQEVAQAVLGVVNNVQPDWNESDSSAGDYIKNKPTIPAVNNPTITITQGGVTKGSFTLNQSTGDTIALDAGGGSATDVQVDDVSQVVSGVANLKTKNGNYNASTNKLVTESDLPDISTKMDKSNPTGTGSFSLNRLANSIVGDKSFAEGDSNTASGNYSHAEGFFTTASGLFSHSAGARTTAQRAHQFVFGKYNILDTQGDNEASDGKYVEIVGNGSGSNARSNARTLDWSGNEELAGNIIVKGGKIGDGNNATYKLALPDTSSWNADKTIATTDQIPTNYTKHDDSVTTANESTFADNYYTKSELLNLIYPVGSLRMSLNLGETSFMGGTWVLVDAGYALWTASSNAGTFIQPGLPNITGSYDVNYLTWSDAPSVSGALTSRVSTMKNGSTGQSVSKQYGIGFDASVSNAIYGNSNTVQPPAYKVYLYKRIS